jgi:hypothetical protein
MYPRLAESMNIRIGIEFLLDDEGKVAIGVKTVSHGNYLGYKYHPCG